MKKIIILLAILSFCFIQDFNAQSKFGNATLDELNMTNYAPDTTAAAVMLTKSGEIHFVYNSTYGFQFEYTIQAKIKILKNEGLEWCDQQINYYQADNSWKESIKNLSGTTYNLENDKVVKTKLSKEHMFDEDVDKKYKVKKFTMPAAKVGSVIEYKYTIVSDFYYNLRDFTFQSSIPILYTSFEAILPEYFRYNVNNPGYITLKTKNEKVNESFPISHRDEFGKYQPSLKCIANSYKFEGENIPAIKDESFVWTVDDYISKVSFELKSINMPYSMQVNASNSWSNIDKELLESSAFGGNLKKADLFKDEVTKGELTLDNAREIQNTIKEKVKWNDKNSIIPENLKDALKNGIGNNADINFLLINALQAGGFNAFPILMSTRSNGRMPLAHPSISAFNYMITGVQIDTMLYFTDAATKYGDWNILPEKCMVIQARIISPNFSNWVDLSTTTSGLVFKLAQINLSDSKIQANVAETRKGSAALNARVDYNNHKNQEDYIESIKKKLGCEVEDLSIQNLENTNDEFRLSYTQTSDINLGEDYLYITPLVEKLFSDNPFKEENRSFPVQFNYLINYIQMATVTIPDGYVVEEAPRSEKIVLGDNDIVFIYRIVPSEKEIKIHYQYQLKKLLFLPDEYKHLQDYIAKIISKSAEQIVLKKV